MLFGVLKRAILDLHQKEETHSCYIGNVYLWFNITTGYSELNCCSLLCLKTPVGNSRFLFHYFFSSDFDSDFFYFFFRSNWIHLVTCSQHYDRDFGRETVELMQPLYKLKYTVLG